MHGTPIDVVADGGNHGHSNTFAQAVRAVIRDRVGQHFAVGDCDVFIARCDDYGDQQRLLRDCPVYPFDSDNVPTLKARA